MKRLLITVQRYGYEEWTDLEIPSDIPSGHLARLIARSLGWENEGAGAEPGTAYEIKLFPDKKTIDPRASLAKAGIAEGAWLVFRDVNRV